MPEMSSAKSRIPRRFSPPKVPWPGSSPASSGDLLRLVYHQERALPHADPTHSTDQLVVKPQSVPDLQPGVFQRIAESLQGHPGSRAGKGEDRYAVSRAPGHLPGTRLEAERLGP